MGEIQPYKGFFVSFEGIEACGKDTQIVMFTEAMRQYINAHEHAGGLRQLLSLREPGSTKAGEIIREKLLLAKKTENIPLDEITEMLLFAAARRELLAEVLVPALQRGDIVLANRFYDTTRAYQGYGRGLNNRNGYNYIASTALSAVHLDGYGVDDHLAPNLTFYISISVDEMRRRQNRGDRMNVKDRFETEQDAFFDRVIGGYQYMAEMSNFNGRKGRIVTIDGTRSREEIHNEIMERTINDLEIHDKGFAGSR